MEELKCDKICRMLDLYDRLLNGYVLNKAEEASRYGVNERSIQRDIEALRRYLDYSAVESGHINSLVYDRKSNGYRLEHIYKLRLTNSEILAVCKILLDSRAFTKQEMTDILERLVACCVPKANQNLVNELISNEEFHYVEPQHRTVFIDKLWKIGQAIHNHQFISIRYLRLSDRKVITQKIEPVAILFSEYYFYLTAFIDRKDEVRKSFDIINDSFPTIYRVDRIKELTVLNEKHYIPYSDRFEEGEFRKRIQFMYGGRLQKVKFKYYGPDVDAILDRLPTAQITDKEEDGYIIKAEVFGKGIDMWIRSQGDYIKVLEK